VASESKSGPGGAFAPLRITRGTKVFVLTGSGISAESGLATFRDANGLWEQHRVEEVASPEGFRKDPSGVWRFYSQRRAQAESVLPNPAHLALARLGQFLGPDLFLCTQNVDPLHERAGSPQVWHMHGELFLSRCAHGCSPPFEDHGLYLEPGRVPACPACGGVLRPHICWFGEMPFDMQLIARAMHASSLFITVGSSGSVYPAAGFVAELKDRRNPTPPTTVYVGLEEPENLHHFDQCRLGKAGALLPGLFELVE